MTSSRKTNLGKIDKFKQYIFTGMYICGKNMKIFKRMIDIIVVFYGKEGTAKNVNWGEFSKDFSGSILTWMMGKKCIFLCVCMYYIKKKVNMVSKHSLLFQEETAFRGHALYSGIKMRAVLQGNKCSKKQSNHIRTSR